MAYSHEKAYAQACADIKAGRAAKGRITGGAISNDELLRYAGKLKGKVILITGGGSGFGRLMAVEAAKQGAKLVLGDINKASLNETARECRKYQAECIVMAPCDVTNWTSQVELFEMGVKRFSKIDIVFPNAGITEIKSYCNMLEAKDADGNMVPLPPVQLTLDINLIGAIYTTYLGLHFLKQNPAKDGKAIVFTGSMASFHSIPGGPMYTTAKHGILGLLKSIYWPCSAANIQVTSVHPWFTDTGIIEPLTRMALIGIPYCKIEDVISAMISGATDTDKNGFSYAIDPSGVFGIPFAQPAVGKGGYFEALANRSAFKPSVLAVIRDLYLIIRQVLRRFLTTNRGKLTVLGILFGLIALIRR